MRGERYQQHKLQSHYTLHVTHYTKHLHRISQTSRSQELQPQTIRGRYHQHRRQYHTHISAHPTASLLKMNNLDSHPRLLSLSASTPSTSTSSPPRSIISTASTPIPRPSTDSQHAAHHFVGTGRAERSFRVEMRRLWEGVKEGAREHHRSVNAAYEATHGAGMRV